MRQLMDTRSTTIPFIALLVGSTALAFGPWLVRLADVGEVSAAFWRLALAVPMLVAIALMLGKEVRLPSRKVVIIIIAAAFFFAADLGLWHYGIMLTKMANAVLFGNSGSFLFALYGLWIAKVRPSMAQVVGLGLAVLGTVLLLSGSLDLGLENVRGDVLALIAGLLYAGYLIGVDRVRKSVEPLAVIIWASALGAAFLLPSALMLGEDPIPGDWSILFVLALSSQVIGQGILVYAIGRLPPLVVGVALLSQPVVAGTIGWIFYDEVFTLTDWAGAIAVATALVLVRLRPRAAKPTLAA